MSTHKQKPEWDDAFIERAKEEATAVGIAAIVSAEPIVITSEDIFTSLYALNKRKVLDSMVSGQSI